MTNEQKQCLLKYLGYYEGKVDGEWGSLSEKATLDFQKAFSAYNLDPDGICGDNTQKALKHAVAYDMFRAEHKEAETLEPLKGITGNFWDGIKYWTREEFRCQCGGKYCNGFPAEPDKKLILVAENIRKHFGRPGHRSSGLRCKTWNAIQGGVSNSRHLTGKALDFRIEGCSAAQVLAYAITLPDVRYAYDIDGTYVHVDVE